jgi:hypothetical protein
MCSLPLAALMLIFMAVEAEARGRMPRFQTTGEAVMYMVFVGGGGIVLWWLGKQIRAEDRDGGQQAGRAPGANDDDHQDSGRD